MSETFVEHEIDENMQYVEECKEEETVNLNSEDFEMLYANDASTLLVQDADGSYFLLNDAANILVEDAIQVQVEESMQEQGNDSQQLIYYTDEAADDGGVQFVTGDVQQLSDDELTVEHLKLEPYEVQMSDGDDGVVIDSSIRYVLKDGQLHLQTYEDPSLPPPNAPVVTDVAKITGRNLITGQTVTLDSYIDKLQRKLMRADETRDAATSRAKTNDATAGEGDLGVGGAGNTGEEVGGNDGEGVINKKLVLGKMANGRKLVGKILKIERRSGASGGEMEAEQAGESGGEVRKEWEGKSPVEGIEDIHQADAPRNVQELLIDESGNILRLTEQPRVVKSSNTTTLQNLENVARTLSGLMDMESVKKKLQGRTLLVKLVEKRLDVGGNTVKKGVSYLLGYMRPAEGGAEDGTWVFVVVIERGRDDVNDVDDLEEYAHLDCESPYSETSCLTLIVTVDAVGKKTTRVNLAPRESAPAARCLCGKGFKTQGHLKRHYANCRAYRGSEIEQMHVQAAAAWNRCETCKREFTSAGSLKRHMSVHFPDLRPLQCTVCLQRFTDPSSLKKHLLIHTGIKAYKCDVCDKAFVNVGDLHFHRRIHSSVKQYTCEVCGREFSRHSNLLRHVEIHKGSGPLYKCDFCGCSYNYISSLTRHVVQHHISQS